MSHELKRIHLANGAGRVVLYDWMAAAFKDGRNLALIASDGATLWRASPPSSPPDCFVGVEWDGHALVANSWSGYCVGVDLQNGEIIVLSFTK